MGISGAIKSDKIYVIAGRRTGTTGITSSILGRKPRNKGGLKEVDVEHGIRISPGLHPG